MRFPIKTGIVSTVVGVALLLQGCPKVEKRIFTVEITNLTNNQPLSPVGVVLHQNGYHAFELGKPASSSIEKLAEGGDNRDVLSDANADQKVISSSSGVGLIAPGQSEEIKIEGVGNDPELSLVSMLVNTNDGFTAVDAKKVSDLIKSETITFYAPVYDAGTEANDESATNVPGQGGEGYNSVRNDRNAISIHSGIVSIDDGSPTSDLDQSYRFDNPVIKVTVTRTQ